MSFLFAAAAFVVAPGYLVVKSSRVSMTTTTGDVEVDWGRGVIVIAPLSVRTSRP